MECSVGWDFFFLPFRLFKPQSHMHSREDRTRSRGQNNLFSWIRHCISLCHSNDACHTRDRHFHQILFLKNSFTPFSLLIFALIHDVSLFFLMNIIWPKTIYFQSFSSISFDSNSGCLKRSSYNSWTFPEPSLEHTSPPHYTILSSLKIVTISWPIWESIKKCVNKVRIASHLLSICL